jgi:flagellar hook protein FlgE
MGLFGALYTGVSGLNAQAQAQSAISENVANVNTVGYKKVATNFSTLVVESSPRSYSPGGPFTSTNYQISEQGALQGTTSNTDIGISGDGFIIVNEAAVPGIKDEFFYTRAGKFTTDRDGYLKNTAGFYLQGWKLDSQGSKPTNNTSLISLQSVNIGSVPGKAIATTEATVEIQMPATSPIDSVADPSLGLVSGSQQSSDIVVYDSLGIPQTVRMVWTHVGTNAWNLTINPGSYGNPPVANKVTNVLDTLGAPLSPPNQLGTPLVAGNQHLRVTFNNNGTLRDITNANTGTSVYNNTDSTVKIRFDFSASGANPQQDVSFDFGPKNLTTPTIGASTAAVPFAVATSSITGIFGTVLG